MDRQSFAKSAADGSCDIGIVVVAYRAAGHLDRLLTSLKAHGRALRWRCVVVDNSASDEVREVVLRHRATGDWLDLIVPDRNLGYATACNLGVRHLGRVRWAMIVNPDVVMTRSLVELVRVAETIPAGLVSGGVTAVPRGRRLSNIRPRLSPRREIASSLGFRSEKPIVLPEGGRASRAKELSGALLLFRPEFYRSVGGMDEFFELYYEDSDLSLRVESRGGCWIDEREYARHEAGSTTAKGSAPNAYRVLRVSRVRVLRKHWGVLGLAAAAVTALVETLARSVTARPEGAAVRCRSLGDQWREMRSPGSVQILHPSAREAP